MHPTNANLLTALLRAAQSAVRTAVRCLRALILEVSDELADEIERTAEIRAYTTPINELAVFPVAVTDTEGVEYTSYSLSMPHPIDDVPYPWERGNTEGRQ